MMSRDGDTALLDALAGAVRGLAKAEARGDLASLRRLDLNAPASAVFYRIVARHAPQREKPDDLRALAQILAMMALKPDALAPGRLGRTLAGANVSEARVQRLLAARGETFRDLALRTGRLLARQETLPYRELGLLVLAKTETFAEEIRMRVARDYWGQRSDNGAVSDTDPASNAAETMRTE